MILSSIDFDLKAMQCAASARKLNSGKLSVIVESALHFDLESQKAVSPIRDHVDEDFSTLVDEDA